MARTITNPANNSALSSLIVRTELQTLETEIADTSTGHTHNGSDSRAIAITNTTGTLLPSHGGTGIANNAASTLTITGSFATTFTISGATSLTLPTSGTVTALGNSTTGSGNIVLATSATLTTPTLSSPTLTTPALGVATATSINGLTISSSTGTFTLTNGKTFAVTNTLTLSGTDSTVMTFPSTTATLGGLGIAQTWTGQNKFNNLIDVNNAVTVSSNAGTVPVTFRLNTFTNSSAATMAITLATTNAVDGQMTIVRIYDFSAATQTIGWTNTENSIITAPTTSNGSTTLPLTVGFMFNSATTKWRCIASS